MKKIVTIGGGTGQPIALAALRGIENIDIKAIVSTLDDGGSTGRLRKQLGILPPADAYRCAIALSPHQNELRSFLRKRFSSPEMLKGHRVGNMLLAMLCQMTNDFKTALKAFEEVVEAKGHVIPSTTEETILCAEYSDGSILRGEDAIDDPEKINDTLKISRLFTSTEAKVDSEATHALREANLILFGPGDLYTSILANVVIGDMAETIRNSNAKLLYISNLMTKRGQTHGMGTKELVSELEKYIGRSIDVVIINNKEIPVSIVQKYQASREDIIKNNIDINKYKILKDDIIKEDEDKKEAHDVLFRSCLRHDSFKLKNIIKKVIDIC